MNKDKYKNAILQYELHRLAIKDLTNKIGRVGQDSCEDIKGSPPFATHCIERFWEDNIDSMIAIKNGEISRDEVDALPHETLCPRCSKIDEIVVKRKLEKKQFGISKRRISAIARGILRGKSNE